MAMATWVSPTPRRTVWWVSSSRVTLSPGSSSSRRWRAAPSLSSSAWVWALIATARSGSGKSMGSAFTGVPFGASVSPVTVPDELRRGRDVAGHHRRSPAPARGPAP